MLLEARSGLSKSGVGWGLERTVVDPSHRGDQGHCHLKNNKFDIAKYVYPGAFDGLSIALHFL